ncbi:MAG: hypothetical protein EOL86_11605 [Deltaproteobacteria bacterium]|nr:hypothetical protein [Deltaproteobacteria bacterium]
MTDAAPEARMAGEIPAMLRSLAWAMEDLGVGMVYYGGLGPLARRGQELVASAAVARIWADEAEAESQYRGEAEEPEEDE